MVTVPVLWGGVLNDDTDRLQKRHCDRRLFTGDPRLQIFELIWSDQLEHCTATKQFESAAVELVTILAVADQ